MIGAIIGLASEARPTARAQKVIPRSNRLRNNHERPSATNHRRSTLFRVTSSTDTIPPHTAAPGGSSPRSLPGAIKGRNRKNASSSTRNSLAFLVVYRKRLRFVHVSDASPHTPPRHKDV